MELDLKMTNLVSFFKGKKKTIKFDIHTDIHAHLIPNIDDGPKTMEAALALIRGLKSLGYHTLTATPHVYTQFYPNTVEIIQTKFNQLQKAVEKGKIDIQLKCAAEYYLEDTFEVLLAEDKVLKLEGDRVLVETSLMAQDPKLLHYIFNIQMKGLQPVLAHPERYTYMSEKDYQHLIDGGCEFQLNLLSLEGHYGKEVLKKARYLLKQKYINFVGSDVHHLKHLNKLTKFIRSGKAVHLLQQQTLFNNALNK